MKNLSIKFNKLVFGVGVFLASLSLQAEVALIVHPSIPINAIDRKTAANLFLGKTNNLSNEIRIEPLDQEENEAVKGEFYAKVANKDASQLNAYWSRLIFTGKGHPPKTVLDDDEVIEIISNEPGYIGYINAEVVDDSVKVLLVIP